MPKGDKPLMRLGDGVSEATDILKLAREDRVAAQKLALTMAKQLKSMASKLQGEKQAARAVISKMSAEKFSKRAQSKHARELRQRRERIKSMKQRLLVGSRKLSLAQRLAGWVGFSRLEEELEEWLQTLGQGKNGRRKLAQVLGAGELLHGIDDAAPEHLRGVYRAMVGRGVKGDGFGTALSEVSPKRIIADAMARTLQGTAGLGSSEGVEVHKAAGRTFEAWNRFSNSVNEALAKDPLDPSAEFEQETKNG